MNGLTISRLRLDAGGRGHDVVDDLDLVVEPGSVLALVGESGAGKTTVGLAALGHARSGVKFVHGDISVCDQPVLGVGRSALRALRGRSISYVPQDPASALNPSLRIGTQIRQVLEAHDFGNGSQDRRDRMTGLLAEVSLPHGDEFLRRYPHQLSGGEQQRVTLAMAFACRPTVMVLDEPTTGLDVSTQSHILDTIRHLCVHHQVAALYITHDLAVVASIADRVAVMYAGRIVEEGPTSALLSNPAHPYTRHLVAAVPDPTGQRAVVGLEGFAPGPGERPPGCPFAPRCSLAHDACRAAIPGLDVIADERRVRCVAPFAVPRSIQHPGTSASRATIGSERAALSLVGVRAAYNGVRAVSDITFDIERGECLALVGESGSGKSTLVRSIGGLHHEWTGEIRVGGTPLATRSRARTVAQRLAIQFVFQNPYQSLNPRRTVGQSVARPLMIGARSKAEARRTAGEMLERVSLDSRIANRFPGQLSGGERQRAAIARALVSTPEVLICDEVTSALDGVVQAAIVELLIDLQRDLGLSMLFVTHNLPLVRTIADRVAVMAVGNIVEIGSASKILTNPDNDHTKRLLGDMPSVPAIAVLRGVESQAPPDGLGAGGRGFGSPLPDHSDLG